MLFVNVVSAAGWREQEGTKKKGRRDLLRADS